VGGEGEK